MQGNEEINIVALAKDGQRYVFLFDDVSTPDIMQTLGKYASDPELDFTWYDAAVMSQRIRRMREKSIVEESDSSEEPFRRTA